MPRNPSAGSFSEEEKVCFVFHIGCIFFVYKKIILAVLLTQNKVLDRYTENSTVNVESILLGDADPAISAEPDSAFQFDMIPVYARAVFSLRL
jgi:hypothetical protein